MPSLITKLRQNNRHKLVDSLVTNARNKRVLFANGAFYYIDDTGRYHILQGLLPVLKRNYWPHTNFTSIMKQPRDVRVGGKKNKKRKKDDDFVVKKPSKGWFFGSIQGKQVHNELDDFILLDDKNFKKKHTQLHPWTKRLLVDIICRMKWLPIKCEFAVCDESIRVGTAIDMICVDPSNGNLIFIEFKTGYASYFENNDGQMKRCLSFMKNSPLNWANVQLVSSVMMLLKYYPHIPLSHTSSYVIRIDDSDIHYYHIDNSFIKKMHGKLLVNLKEKEKIRI